MKFVKWPRLAAILFACVALAACDNRAIQQAVIGKFVPDEASQDGRHYVELLRAGQVDQVARDFDPQYRTPELAPGLAQAAALFPHENPRSVEVVGANTFVMSGGTTTYRLLYEYEFSHVWVLAEVVLRKQGNGLQLEGLHVQQRRQSLEQENAFALSGKPPVQIALFAAVCFNALLTVVTVIFCFVRPIPKRRWLWVIFVLFGVGQVSLNWTTGQIGFNPFSIVLFSAGWLQQLNGPAMLQIGLPLGAVAFWIRRREWVEAARDADLRVF